MSSVRKAPMTEKYFEVQLKIFKENKQVWVDARQH